MVMVDGDDDADDNADDDNKDLLYSTIYSPACIGAHCANTNSTQYYISKSE